MKKTVSLKIPSLYTYYIIIYENTVSNQYTKQITIKTTKTTCYNIFIITDIFIY